MKLICAIQEAVVSSINPSDAQFKDLSLKLFRDAQLWKLEEQHHILLVAATPLVNIYLFSTAITQTHIPEPKPSTPK